MRRVALTLLAVVAMATSVLYASHAQRETADLHAHEEASPDGSSRGSAAADAALATFALTGEAEPLDEYSDGVEQPRRDLAAAATAAMTTRPGVCGRRRAAPASSRGGRPGRRRLARPATRARGASPRRRRAARAVDRVIAANDRLQARQAVLAAREDQRASLVPPCSSSRSASCSAPLRPSPPTGPAGPPAGSPRSGRCRAASARPSRPPTARPRRTGCSRPTSSGSIPGTTITVLNRNNSADRLEASTQLAEDSPLAEALVEARPRRAWPSGSAGRSARARRRGGHGLRRLRRLRGGHTCQPLLVGGEVIGAALVEHAAPCRPATGARRDARCRRRPRRSRTSATSRSPRRARRPTPSPDSPTAAPSTTRYCGCSPRPVAASTRCR